MKKILSAVIFSAILFFSLQEKAFAYDIYCGTYSDGSEAYLMTETIQHAESEWYYHITCRVKVMKNGSLIKRLDYSFSMEGGGVMFINSEGNGGVFGGRRNSNPYPIAAEILEQSSKYIRGR